MRRSATRGKGLAKVVKQVENVIAKVQSAFTTGIAIIGAPAALLSSFTGRLTGLVGSLTARPLASTYGLASLLPGIVGMPTDPDTPAPIGRRSLTASSGLARGSQCKVIRR